MKTNKLILALIAGGLIGMASASSFAAGLGRLTVHSSLGQPLQAEIELLSIQKVEMETLSARVAPQEAFQEAKIEYSAALQGINFNIDTKPNGQPYLRITSTQPINEPFVDMLVELNWLSGRLVREFPLLLDPPGFTANKAPAAAAVVSQATAQPEKPRADVRRAETAPATSTSAGTISDQYVVKPGESLSKIAGKVRSKGVNLDQMLVALFRQNKHAFVGDNMNRLKARATLRVPPLVHHLLVNRVAGREPLRAVGREGPLVGQPQPAVDRHPRHELRIDEMPPAPADAPFGASKQ